MALVPRTKVLLVAMTACVAWGLLCAAGTSADEPPAQGVRDSALFGTVVTRLRAGESYYPVFGQELEARGYATASVFNWRLPTLAVFQASLPSLRASSTILTTIGVGTIALWCWALRAGGLGRAALAIPLLLTMIPAWRSESVGLIHDVWAGQLIALSLALWASGFLSLSVASGYAAASIRELAVPYLIVMAGLAFWESRPREGRAWLVAIGAFLVLFGWHALRVLPAIPAHPLGNTWLSFGGWCFVLRAARANLALTLAPTWVNALVVPVAWIGLWMWNTPVGRRLTATVTLYIVSFVIIGRPDNWYWGFLVAPLLPLGAFGWLPSLRPGAVAAIRARPTAE
jgi:hypothetical protein